MDTDSKHLKPAHRDVLAALRLLVDRSLGAPVSTLARITGASTSATYRTVGYLIDKGYAQEGIAADDKRALAGGRALNRFIRLTSRGEELADDIAKERRRVAAAVNAGLRAAAPEITWTEDER